MKPKTIAAKKTGPPNSLNDSISIIGFSSPTPEYNPREKAKSNTSKKTKETSYILILSPARYAKRCLTKPQNANPKIKKTRISATIIVINSMIVNFGV